MVFGPHHAILPCNKYTLIWSYWNTLIKEPVSIKGAEVPYLRGHQRVYLNPQCSVYIALKQDPVSFSCRLLHTKHSFCVLTCFLLNLVRHAKLHTRNYWRQRSSQYLSLKQHFVNVFKSGKAQNCRFLFVHIPIYSVWKCVFATTYYL